ncbi:MAG: hypothetical protein OXE78_03945 [Gammaproteobacteria bacterium]|nr:hypothetical protein [Gammaproteobacteria bacterium]MCY4356786.1 hypothetical protein [Gammaproteobacteria bacterium]
MGTSDWEDSLYRKKPGSKMQDMFETEDNYNQTERIDAEGVQSWVTNRLKFLFPYVAEPKLLDNNGRPLFLFYFAVSNNSPKARQLADKVIQSVMQQRTMK